MSNFLQENDEEKTRMPIPYIVDTEEKVPETLKDFYIKNEETEQFVLDVSDVKSFQDYKETVDAFEATKKEKEQLQESLKAFGEYTPEAIKKLQDDLKIAESSTVGDNAEAIDAKVQEIVSIRVQEHDKVVKSLNEQIDSISSERSKLQAAIDDNTMQQRIREVSKDKINKYAFNDVVSRAKADGIKYNDTVKDLYQKDTGLKIDDWLVKQLELNPHWRPQSVSGGASGGSGQGGSQSNSIRDLVTEALNSK